MKELKGPVEKLPSGIPGFDLISHGGLQKYRTTLVSGTVGGIGPRRQRGVAVRSVK